MKKDKNSRLKFIGMDLSLTNSGVCVVNNDGGILAIDSVRTEPCGDTIKERFARYEYIARKIKEISKNVCGKTVAIAMENYSYGSKGRIIQLVEAGTLVRRMTYISKVEHVIEVAPIQLKKFLLGKVKGKGKNVKNIMCREVFREFGDIIDDDNQVDAFILARIAWTYWRHLQVKNGEVPLILMKPQAEVLSKLLQKHGG